MNTIDNGRWISIHGYVMQNWVKLPMMIFFQIIVYGAGVDNLTIVIMEALQNGEGLSSTIVIKKLLCFGANGVNKFKGIKTRPIKQINTNYAPFSIGVHYMAHKRNLAFKTLSTLGIINNIEDLLWNHHAYFAHNPKGHLEFIKLTNMRETKRLKMFKNMKPCWISLLDFLRKLLLEYMPFLAKMSMDSNNNQVAKVTLYPKLLYVFYIVCYLLQCFLHFLIDG